MMKKHQTSLCKTILILSMAIFMLHSCKKSDDGPQVVEEVSYTIGDTLVSQFIDENTNQVLQQVVFEVVNIGNDQDTVAYLAVKSHSNMDEPGANSHDYYDVITTTEIDEFMDDLEAIYGIEAGEMLVEFEEKYGTSMQFIIGGCIESEMDINAYFNVLETIDAYYMDETLPYDDIANMQVDYFLDFIFYHGIDVDDLLLLLSERGLSITDLMDEMDTFDFSTISSVYPTYTDALGIEGFAEFLDGFFELTKSTKEAQGGTGEIVLKFVGKMIEEIIKEAGSSFDSNSFSGFFSLLYAEDINPLNYIGAIEADKNIRWQSGANYDHLSVNASCEYNLTTDKHDGLFISNAQIRFTNILIRGWHHISTEISSSALNKGTLERPIAQITTRIQVKLRIKCGLIGRNYSDNYKVIFRADNGISIAND